MRTGSYGAHSGSLRTTAAAAAAKLFSRVRLCATTHSGSLRTSRQALFTPEHPGLDANNENKRKRLPEQRDWQEEVGAGVEEGGRWTTTSETVS